MPGPRLPPEIRTTFRTIAWQGDLTKDPATWLKLIRGLIKFTPPELIIDGSPHKSELNEIQPFTIPNSQ
jgi:hypothetical protein